jgi:hypothetical protein
MIFKTSVLFTFLTYSDIEKESYKITNINVWQLFPIHLTFSYQNSQLSIVIVVFSWIDFRDLL